MVARCKNWILLALAMLLLVIAPAGLAQAPAGTSIFSIWVRLSLRGFNQEEIESLLQNLDRKSVANVKARLRRTVLGNLELKKNQRANSQEPRPGRSEHHRLLHRDGNPVRRYAE